MKALGNWRFFYALSVINLKRYNVTKLHFPYLAHNFKITKNQGGCLNLKNFVAKNIYPLFYKVFRRYKPRYKILFLSRCVYQ